MVRAAASACLRTPSARSISCFAIARSTARDEINVRASRKLLMVWAAGAIGDSSGSLTSIFGGAGGTAEGAAAGAPGWAPAGAAAAAAPGLAAGAAAAAPGFGGGGCVAGWAPAGTVERRTRSEERNAPLCGEGPRIRIQWNYLSLETSETFAAPFISRDWYGVPNLAIATNRQGSGARATFASLASSEPPRHPRPCPRGARRGCRRGPRARRRRASARAPSDRRYLRAGSPA